MFLAYDERLDRLSNLWLNMYSTGIIFIAPAPFGTSWYSGHHVRKDTEDVKYRSGCAEFRTKLTGTPNFVNEKVPEVTSLQAKNKSGQVCYYYLPNEAYLDRWASLFTPEKLQEARRALLGVLGSTDAPE